MPSKLMCVCGDPAIPPEEPPAELVIVLLDPCPPKSVCDGSDCSCDVLLDCCDNRWNCVSPRGRALNDCERSIKWENELKENPKNNNSFHFRAAHNGLRQLEAIWHFHTQRIWERKNVNNDDEQHTWWCDVWQWWFVMWNEKVGDAGKEEKQADRKFSYCERGKKLRSEEVNWKMGFLIWNVG